MFLTLRVAWRTAGLLRFAHRVPELRCLELAERHKKNCTLTISLRKIGRSLATIRIKNCDFAVSSNIQLVELETISGVSFGRGVMRRSRVFGLVWLLSSFVVPCPPRLENIGGSWRK